MEGPRVGGRLTLAFIPGSYFGGTPFRWVVRDVAADSVCASCSALRRLYSVGRIERRETRNSADGDVEVPAHRTTLPALRASAYSDRNRKVVRQVNSNDRIYWWYNRLASVTLSISTIALVLMVISLVLIVVFLVALALD